MLLKNIYQKDIDRNINGVIKVAQDDEAVIVQELQEYIITKELRKHFNTFLDAYERSLSQPTDRIGVWISGFFGSGKSHFLKILSYLLENDIVAGKRAVEYFADKFDDRMMYMQLENCTKVPTATILFNIDSKSPVNKDKTAILRVFAKVFYEHRGFYGDDLKIAKLEQFIDKSGKTELFKEKFKEINGDDWEEARTAYTFFEDDIVEVMQQTLNNAMALVDKVEKEKEYFQRETSAMQALSQIELILKMQKPYQKIKDLTELSLRIKEAYANLLDIKRSDVVGDIRAAMAEIHQTAKDDPQSRKIVDDADTELKSRENDASTADTLTTLDAMKSRIVGIRQHYLQKLFEVGRIDPRQKIKTVRHGSARGGYWEVNGK